jgi:hypothetical protein
MNEFDFLQLLCRRERSGDDRDGKNDKNEGKFPVIILFIRSLICFAAFFMAID